MDYSAAESWESANQRHLTGRLRSLARRLQAAAGLSLEGEEPIETPWTHARPPALELLARAFRLSAFETDFLLLCAGVEMDAEIARTVSVLGDDPQRLPTFGLAMAMLPGAHWSALSPHAPLRYWRLLELANGPLVTRTPVYVDERVLHFLAGLGEIDIRLSSAARVVPAPSGLLPTHEEAAERARERWMGVEGAGAPVVILAGDDLHAKRAVAGAMASGLGLRLWELAAESLPVAEVEREQWARLWEREGVMTNAALLVTVDDPASSAERGRLARWLDGLQCRTLLSIVGAPPPVRRAISLVEVRRPQPEEQRQAWRLEIGNDAALENGSVNRVVQQFRFPLEGVRRAAALARGMSGGEHADGDPLWEACRRQARSTIDDLAQRIEPRANWKDLILPETEMGLLRQVFDQVSHRWTVYESWGFGKLSERGLGISALFVGASGTGKTTAAEVLAGSLRLDLYRIDLSAVVSKYIGETEKNLRRIFDAADEGGAVLLFDEADALFGKRSEVKDSHDRYANIEVSYLLQRMEAYRGLAILTTNMKTALDVAFTRRLRFVVQFPFPGPEERAVIWRRSIPPEAPTEGLDLRLLARLNVTGGSIRNIALNAAFLAAAEGSPIRMEHALQAASTEYAKLEKMLTDSETAGWLG